MVNGAFTYDIGELEPPRIRNEPKTAEPRARPLFEQIWNPANHVKSLSLLAGYAAGEVYSIYAVFEVNGLAPVSAYMTEHTPYLRAVSGKYREVFDLGGVLPIVAVSFVVFALAWCAVRGIAFALAGSEPARVAPNTSAIRR